MFEKRAIEKLASPNCRADGGELDAAADHVQLAAERGGADAAAARDEAAGAPPARSRGRARRSRAESTGTSRQPSGTLALLVRDAHEQLLADQPLAGIAREEAHRDGVLAGRRQLGAGLLARPAAQEARRAAAAGCRRRRPSRDRRRSRRGAPSCGAPRVPSRRSSDRPRRRRARRSRGHRQRGRRAGRTAGSGARRPQRREYHRADPIGPAVRRFYEPFGSKGARMAAAASTPPNALRPAHSTMAVRKPLE